MAIEKGIGVGGFFVPVEPLLSLSTRINQSKPSTETPAVAVLTKRSNTEVSKEAEVAFIRMTDRQMVPNMQVSVMTGTTRGRKWKMR